MPELDGLELQQRLTHQGILIPIIFLTGHGDIPMSVRASITQPLHPHLFRHQMLTYLTSKGLSDAHIQLISGHESKKSLEVYQHLSLESVDKAYQDAVQSVGI
jgi:site-specific recombinase XerD